MARMVVRCALPAAPGPHNAAQLIPACSPQLLLPASLILPALSLTSSSLPQLRSPKRIYTLLLETGLTEVPCLV